MTPRRVTGSAARRGPFKAKAQAAAASSKATPVPAHKRQGMPRRSAMADVTNYLNFSNENIFDVEGQSKKVDLPNYTAGVLRSSELAFQDFVEFLAMRMLLGQGYTHPSPNQVVSVTSDLHAEIESGNLSDSLTDMINNKEIWFSFLHITAMMAKGMINSDTIEHTNLRKQYTADDAGSRGFFSGHAADAGCAASVSDAPVQPRAPSPTQSPAPPLPHPLSTSCNSLCSLSESGCLDPALAEEDGGQQDDSDDQFVPQAVIENAEEYWQQGDDDDDESVFQAAEDANEDEDVLDPEEQIINNAKPASPRHHSSCSWNAQEQAFRHPSPPLHYQNLSQTWP